MWWNVSVFEDLHNSEPVFSKWPMRDITKSCLVRNPSQVLARPMDLNVTEIILTRFFIPVYCNQLSSFGVVLKESIHIYLKKGYRKYSCRLSGYQSLFLFFVLFIFPWFALFNITFVRQCFQVLYLEICH